MAYDRRTALLANRFDTKIQELQHYWSERNTQFGEWYSTLRLEDKYKVEKMESFVSNDPRTLYNLALFLLTPKVVPINIPIEGANDTEQSAIAQTEAFFSRQWASINTSMRKRSKQGWLRYFNSLSLATGWYAVRAIASQDGGLSADIWNPSQVYPDFDPEVGLSCVAHCYTTSGSGARKTVAMNRNSGWSYDFGSSMMDVQVADYWYYDDNGTVSNCVLFDRKFAKPPTPHPQFKEIPVHCSPISGLPDNGSIDKNQTDWKRHVGEAIVSTNSQLYDSFNRQMTFMMQILRDTAQPRLKVKSKTKGIVTEGNWNKRGAIYELDVDEDIEAIAMPGVPPELSLNSQMTSRMIERGGLPFALYTGEGISSGYHQSLVSAGADEILRDYRQASSFCMTDISNSWLQQIRDQNLSIDKFVIPEGFPDDALFDIDIEVSIPGDLIQRATTARQLDPAFSISTTTTMDMLFPEIRDPNREMVLSRRDMAMRHPMMATLDLISALQEQAQALVTEGNTQQAQLYMETASKLQQSIDAQIQPQTPPNGPPGIGNAGMQ